MTVLGRAPGGHAVTRRRERLGDPSAHHAGREDATFCTPSTMDNPYEAHVAGCAMASGFSICPPRTRKGPWKHQSSRAAARIPVLSSNRHCSAVRGAHCAVARPTMIATDKRALVVGVADNQSVARGVARARHRPGAMLAITYLNEKAEPHVRPPADRVNAPDHHAARRDTGAGCGGAVRTNWRGWSGLDILVHSIAFAPGGDLRGRSSNSSLGSFSKAMDTSVHSFIRLARRPNR